MVAINPEVPNPNRLLPYSPIELNPAKQLVTARHVAQLGDHIGLDAIGEFIRKDQPDTIATRHVLALAAARDSLIEAFYSGIGLSVSGVKLTPRELNALRDRTRAKDFRAIQQELGEKGRTFPYLPNSIISSFNALELENIGYSNERIHQLHGSTNVTTTDRLVYVFAPMREFMVAASDPTRPKKASELFVRTIVPQDRRGQIQQVERYAFFFKSKFGIHLPFLNHMKNILELHDLDTSHKNKDLPPALVTPDLMVRQGLFVPLLKDRKSIYEASTIYDGWII